MYLSAGAMGFRRQHQIPLELGLGVVTSYHMDSGELNPGPLLKRQVLCWPCCLFSMSVARWGSPELPWWYLSLTIKRVRVAAAESMPLLLECARVRGPEYLTQMWHFMCDALIKAIGTEPDSDVLSEIMHSFAKVSRVPEHSGSPGPAFLPCAACLVLCWGEDGCLVFHVLEQFLLRRLTFFLF